ncbi:MAG: response regulator [bacterium]|nr:response regulator [bacterium]
MGMPPGHTRQSTPPPRSWGPPLILGVVWLAPPLDQLLRYAGWFALLLLPVLALLAAMSWWLRKMLARRTVELEHEISEHQRVEEEKKELEAQIRQAHKFESLGLLAGGIAHDFNNLLAGMLGNTRMALLESSADSRLHGRLRDIETAGHRAAELCRQMLAYAGRGQFIVQTLNFSALAADMARLLEGSISDNAVLERRLAPKLPNFEGDATQIRQVIMNLITNASDALGDGGGRITLATGVMPCDREYLRQTYLAEELPEGAYLFLEVTDTGCGMDRETRERMFDPFFSTKLTGRGLGLANTLGVVRGHGGALKVDSEPGKGTTFRVLFPCLGKPVTRPAEVAVREDGARGGEGTVLVVDGEAVVCALACKVLERVGYRVLTAASGREGLEIFRRHAEEISAVLLDMTVPRPEDAETFREMRRLRDDVAVILSSGYRENEVTPHLSPSGGTRHFADYRLAGFIRKPYNPGTLVEAIRKATAKG